jgi:hypothetical protein
MAMGVVVGGVFGARLSHLIVEPDKFTELADFYSLFRPGTPGNVVGLMVGGYLGGLVVRRSLGLPSLGNYFAPALARLVRGDPCAGWRLSRPGPSPGDSERVLTE